MEGVAKQKVPGGKMLIIKVRFGERTESVQILGDFFIYPEDSLERVERALTDLSTNESVEFIRERIEEVVKRDGIEMVGINPEAIARTLKAAVKR